MVTKCIDFWNINSRTASFGAKSTAVVGFLKPSWNNNWGKKMKKINVFSGIVKTSRWELSKCRYSWLCVWKKTKKITTWTLFIRRCLLFKFCQLCCNVAFCFRKWVACTPQSVRTVQCRSLRLPPLHTGMDLVTQNLDFRLYILHCTC